jgi:hypothetical protein
VRLFSRITHGEWTLTLCVLPYDFQKKLERASHKEEETISPRTPPTPTAEHCALHFIGAPAVVRLDSNKPRAAPPKPTPATTMTMAMRQDVLRRLLGRSDDLPRTATPPPRIDKPAVARLVRPHLPRVEIPSLPTVPPSAGPMFTPTVPPPPAQGLPPPPSRNPAIDGPESPSPEELAVSRADARVRLIVTEQEAMRGQLVSERQGEDVEARLVAARAEAGRQHDIITPRADRWRDLGGPLPPPPLPERPSAGGNRSDRKAIQKAQFNQVMDARREADARVWDYAKQRDIEGLLEERRRQTTENLAQCRSGSKSGGSKSGGSKSGGSGEHRRETPPPPCRELTPPRRPTSPRARARTPPRAPTPPRDRTRSDRRGDRRARTPSPPPRRRLRSDSLDRGPPRPTQERRPGPSSRGGKK